VWETFLESAQEDFGASMSCYNTVQGKYTWDLAVWNKKQTDVPSGGPLGASNSKGKKKSNDKPKEPKKPKP
jgi:hypothetical protein